EPQTQGECTCVDSFRCLLWRGCLCSSGSSLPLRTPVRHRRTPAPSRASTRRRRGRKAAYSRRPVTTDSTVCPVKIRRRAANTILRAAGVLVASFETSIPSITEGPGAQTPAPHQRGALENERSGGVTSGQRRAGAGEHEGESDRESQDRSHLGHAHTAFVL